MKKPSSLIISPFGSILILIIFLCNFNVIISSALKFKDATDEGFLVTKDQRETVTVTEYGQISAVQINDGFNGSYHLHFITLEPNSLFLPVLLHADMVFYVHTGSGSMTWVDEEKKNEINVNKGDIHRFPSGSVFYIKSSLESTREKLRIYAIFTDSNTAYPQNLFIGPYSTLSDLVLGFDKKVLQSAFQVPQEVLDEITGATKPPAIVHMTSKEKSSADHPDWRAGIIETIVRGGFSSDEFNGKKKKKTKTFNILDKKPDFSNCNGWSVAVNNKDFRALKDSDIGVFMVNLTKGAMMGPHWNPRASEIAVVTHGEGMISVVCPSSRSNERQCKNMRFKVKEGDVFTVPRFYPMAQMAYNNDSLVFMGFSTNARKNHPQFLAGKSSVFLTLDKDILAMSFNVPNTTTDHLLGSQVESIILECVSCAEEEEERLREEIEKKKQEEEAKKREEEEARRREEEEKAREREREEEEARRREEEKRKQEEEARRREEEAKREEEEAKREEEERQAKERREEEERQEEEARRREAAKREEEEAKREAEERQARERQEEEQEEEAKREEEERQKEEEQEEEQERQKEEARQRREEEEAQAREEEEREEARRADEEAQRRREEEEAQRREEEREEEAQRREEREEEARRSEDERQGREREEEVRRQEEEREGGRGRGEARRVLTKMWKI